MQSTDSEQAGHVDHGNRDHGNGAQTDAIPLVIWGAGALGMRVGMGWRRGPVQGHTATTARHAALQAAGIQPLTGAPMHLGHDAMLLLALPGHANQAEAVRHCMQRGIPAPRRVVMVSTTGYYGTPSGRVDEETPPDGSPRSQSIAAVEEMLQEWAGPRGVILRMGGLYGPERGPGAALARRGTTSPKAPDRTLPLIHYDDATRAVLAALHHPQPQAAYLTVTPPCPTRGEFYTEAYRRLGLGTPPFAPPLGVEPARYDVSRLRRDLLPRPAFPDWHAALPAARGQSSG